MNIIPGIIKKLDFPLNLATPSNHWFIHPRIFHARVGPIINEMTREKNANFFPLIL